MWSLSSKYPTDIFTLFYQQKYWQISCIVFYFRTMFHFRCENWNILYVFCTSKSRRASSWFWMIGRVFISFSTLIVRITPSVLHRIYRWCEVPHSWNWKVWSQLYTFKCRHFCLIMGIFAPHPLFILVKSTATSL